MSMENEYHPITGTIQDLLTQHDCWFETFEHEPVRTSEEAAAVRPGYTLNQGAKALIVRWRKSSQEAQFVMFVFPAGKKLDNRRARTLLGGGDIRFASEEDVLQLTDGVQPGAVPPFGGLFGLPVYADRTLFANEKIVFNAGDRRFSVAMRSSDYLTLGAPTVADLIQQ